MGFSTAIYYYSLSALILLVLFLVVVHSSGLKDRPDDADAIPKVTLVGPYSIYRKSLTWAEAQSYCEAHEGQLATFNEYEKATSVVDKIYEISAPLTIDYIKGLTTSEFGLDRRYWIGLTDLVGGEGKWEWAGTGKPLLYDVMWYPGQPDHIDEHNNYLGRPEHCVALWNPVFHKRNEHHTFADQECKNKYYFVCERNDEKLATQEKWKSQNGGSKSKNGLPVITSGTMEVARTEHSFDNTNNSYIKMAQTSTAPEPVKHMRSVMRLAKPLTTDSPIVKEMPDTTATPNSIEVEGVKELDGNNSENCSQGSNKTATTPILGRSLTLALSNKHKSLKDLESKSAEPSQLEAMDFSNNHSNLPNEDQEHLSTLQNPAEGSSQELKIEIPNKDDPSGSNFSPDNVTREQYSSQSEEDSKIESRLKGIIEDILHGEHPTLLPAEKVDTFMHISKHAKPKNVMMAAQNGSSSETSHDFKSHHGVEHKYTSEQRESKSEEEISVNEEPTTDSNAPPKSNEIISPQSGESSESKDMEKRMEQKDSESGEELATKEQPHISPAAAPMDIDDDMISHRISRGEPEGLTIQEPRRSDQDKMSHTSDERLKNVQGEAVDIKNPVNIARTQGKRLRNAVGHDNSHTNRNIRPLGLDTGLGTISLEQERNSRGPPNGTRNSTDSISKTVYSGRLRQRFYNSSNNIEKPYSRRLLVHVKRNDPAVVDSTRRLHKHHHHGRTSQDGVKHSQSKAMYLRSNDEFRVSNTQKHKHHHGREVIKHLRSNSNESVVASPQFQRDLVTQTLVGGAGEGRLSKLKSPHSEIRTDEPYVLHRHRKTHRRKHHTPHKSHEKNPSEEADFLPRITEEPPSSDGNKARANYTQVNNLNELRISHKHLQGLKVRKVLPKRPETVATSGLPLDKTKRIPTKPLHHRHFHSTRRQNRKLPIRRQDTKSEPIPHHEKSEHSNPNFVLLATEKPTIATPSIAVATSHPKRQMDRKHKMAVKKLMKLLSVLSDDLDLDED